jgi:hypothetical protein
MLAWRELHRIPQRRRSRLRRSQVQVAEAKHTRALLEVRATRARRRGSPTPKCEPPLEYDFIDRSKRPQFGAASTPRARETSLSRKMSAVRSCRPSGKPACFARQDARSVRQRTLREIQTGCLSFVGVHPVGLSAFTLDAADFREHTISEMMNKFSNYYRRPLVKGLVGTTAIVVFAGWLLVSGAPGRRARLAAPAQ